MVPESCYCYSQIANAVNSHPIDLPPDVLNLVKRHTYTSAHQSCKITLAASSISVARTHLLYIPVSDRTDRPSDSQLAKSQRNPIVRAIIWQLVIQYKASLELSQAPAYKGSPRKPLRAYDTRCTFSRMYGVTSGSYFRYSSARKRLSHPGPNIMR